MQDTRRTEVRSALMAGRITQLATALDVRPRDLLLAIEWLTHDRPAPAFIAERLSLKGLTMHEPTPEQVERLIGRAS